MTANNICLALKKLADMLNIKSNTMTLVKKLNKCRTAHAFNLALLICLQDVNNSIMKIKFPLQTNRCFAERNSIYEATQIQIGLTVSLPPLKVRTR